MVEFPKKPSYDMDDLVAILRILRGPNGCPWDREQTHSSNRRNFLEEAYEAAEAFDRDDPDAMCEELGDVLLQVLFNIHMEEDAGRFTTADVTDRVVRKLIYRHPHVFGDAHADSAGEVLVNWERLKRAEKGQKTTSDALDAVARSLPALWRADKLLSKAEKAGYAFGDAPQALEKAVRVLQHTSSSSDTDAEEALGEALLAAVALGRRHKLDPEAALHRACEAFIHRFHEEEARNQ